MFYKIQPYQLATEHYYGNCYNSLRISSSYDSCNNESKFDFSIFKWEEKKDEQESTKDKENFDIKDVDSYFYDLSVDNSKSISDIEPEVSDEFNADYYKNELNKHKIARFEEISKELSVKFKSLCKTDKNSKVSLDELMKNEEIAKVVYELSDINRKIEKLKAWLIKKK